MESKTADKTEMQVSRRGVAVDDGGREQGASANVAESGNSLQLATRCGARSGRDGARSSPSLSRPLASCCAV